MQEYFYKSKENSEEKDDIYKDRDKIFVNYES